MLRVQDDTRIHVAQFLQEWVGATRQTRIVLDHLPLDDDMVAHQIESTPKLTRIPTGILASGQLKARVTMQCIRCLDEAETTVEAEYADEYRPSIDILTGAVLDPDEGNEDEAEYFTISGQHLLDLRESLRQAIVLGLPMAPLCRDDCPGLPEAAAFQGEGDARLAILASLLGEDDEDETADQPTESKRRARRSATAND
jgi:uncharacterized protein